MLIWLLSCVQTIEDALATLMPPPYSVNISIVLQSIRVRHNLKLDRETVKLAIESAGFNIMSLTPICESAKVAFLKPCICLTRFLIADAAEDQINDSDIKALDAKPVLMRSDLPQCR